MGVKLRLLYHNYVDTLTDKPHTHLKGNKSTI